MYAYFDGKEWVELDAQGLKNLAKIGTVKRNTCVRLPDGREVDAEKIQSLEFGESISVPVPEISVETPKEKKSRQSPADISGYPCLCIIIKFAFMISWIVSGLLTFLGVFCLCFAAVGLFMIFYGVFLIVLGLIVYFVINAIPELLVIAIRIEKNTRCACCGCSTNVPPLQNTASNT